MNRESHAYLLELHTRFMLVNAELRCAKAHVGKRRRDAATALSYVEKTIVEAQKLKLHLEAWKNYLPDERR